MVRSSVAIIRLNFLSPSVLLAGTLSSLTSWVRLCSEPPSRLLPFSSGNLQSSSRHSPDEGIQVPRDFRLVPLRDLVALGVWTFSYFGDEIEWRGLRFKLRNVRLKHVTWRVGHPAE